MPLVAWPAPEAMVNVTTVLVLLALGAKPTLLTMLTTNSPLLPGSAAVGSDAAIFTNWSDRMFTVAGVGLAEYAPLKMLSTSTTTVSVPSTAPSSITLTGTVI